MRLSTRLFLLVLCCLVPVVGAQVYTQVSLYQQREAELGELALRQAELANADLTSIVDGIRQLGSAIAEFPEVQTPGPACNDRLARLQRSLMPYRFLAVADATGHLFCASSPALLTPAAITPGWVTAVAAGTGVDIGSYTTAPGLDGPFLPIGIAMPNGNGVIVAALDLRWLARHLQETQLGRTPQLPNSTLLLADQQTTVIARFPDSEQWAGHKLPDSVRPLLTQSRPTVTVVNGADGHRQLAAFIPEGLPPVGLVAIEMLGLSDAMAATNNAAWRSAGLLAAAALLALTLAWLLGRRFIYRPTEALLAAAERWGNGDLRARAEANSKDGEFAILARSFNAMAASLAARDQERRLQAELLEAQVAERSRELSHNNNRLHVQIAEREKTEAALNHAQKLQAVGLLAGGISHDFNNMLTTVLGSLELMERRVGNGTQHWTEADAERLRVLITRAIAAVQRGADLSSGLLRFARRARAPARPTDINRQVTELLVLATSALGRRIRLVTQLAETVWPVQVDPSQLEAAVLNLCLNARDAMPEGGTLTIHTANMTLAAGGEDGLPPGDYVRLTVTDTGVGMAPEVQSRAFDPFFSTKGDAGSGLGLSQVQAMVRQSGGTVQLRSTLGQGTEVTVLLPRARTDTTAEPSPHIQGPVRHRLPPMTVLVVDDDQAVRQVTAEMLRDLGCEVIQASGGGEALTLLAAAGRLPDIVLVDYAMPGMNGLELARRLREDGLMLPIGMVTGYAELAGVEAGESPLDALLRKPFTIDELQALMIRLAGRSPRRSNVVRLPVPQRG